MTFVPNIQGGDVPQSPPTYAIYSDSGAITPIHGTVFLSKSTAAAMTLAVPTATLNGIVMHIVSTTAAAHTITATTVGFNAANAAGDVATLAAAIGNGLTVTAYAGEWYVLNNTNATIA